jgi:hypothetical protein
MYALLFVGTTPIGSALVGALAEKSVPAMIMEMAGLCALGIIGGWWYVRGKRSGPLVEAPEAVQD